MKTRFDNSEVWDTGSYTYKISEMETGHLINTLTMFIKYPFRTMSMLLHDVEMQHEYVFSFEQNKALKKESITNITSMNEKQLIEYALNSNLGVAMLNELFERGVNVENVLKVKLSDE